jgi:hypothetical protein
MARQYPKVQFEPASVGHALHLHNRSQLNCAAAQALKGKQFHAWTNMPLPMVLQPISLASAMCFLSQKNHKL